MSLRTCQRCQHQYNTQLNTDRSCVFHRSTYVERGSFTKSWDCCGREAHWARECSIGRHVSYDESWNKSTDLSAIPRPQIYINIYIVRTCQRCNKQFDIDSNTEDSCQFHRCPFGGKIWDCCAAKGSHAQTCAHGKHITYDQKWIKWDDFFIKIAAAKTRIGESGSWIYHPQKGYIMVKWDKNDEYKAIPTGLKHRNDNAKVGMYSDVVNMECVLEICEKYNNRKISEAITELMRKLPFTKVTSYLIAQMIIIDLVKTKKLYGINLIYDLDEETNANTNQITENLISTFSSHTLDTLAEIM